MDASTSRYHDVYARWQRDPEGFWGEAAKAIDWIEPPKKIFDKDAGIYGRWFTGGVVNTCYNALDRHCLAGRNDQAALIYDSPVTNTKQTFTYGRMLSEVQLLGAICATSASRRATSSSSTCRWCRKRCSPCSPARASAPCIRWCSAASRRKSSPPASTTPSRT